MAVIDLGRVIGPQGPQGATGAQGVRGEQGLPGPNQLTNQTATPLTGVIVGENGVVGIRSIDATPTADSNGFPTSGGVKTALDGKVPVYGLGKNLLDNSYFVGGGSQQGGNQFPINSRGNASYSGVSSAYSIDRWAFTYGTPGGSIAFNSGYITLSGNGVFFRQKLNANVLPSETYILSMLLSSGTLLQISGAAPSDSNEYITESGNPLSFNANYVRVYLASGTSYNVVAMKLERGARQTLCHNEGTDAIPVWVLNDVPDYEYELYRCMTSMADSTDTYANKTLATEQQLAPIERGATASRRYYGGEYFCANGKLYRSILEIPSGGNITPGTNCVQDELAGHAFASNIGNNATWTINMAAPIALLFFSRGGYYVGYLIDYWSADARVIIGSAINGITVSKSASSYELTISNTAGVTFGYAIIK